MNQDAIVRELDEALRYCAAGLKALEGARTSALSSGKLYTTHIHLATVELAHAIEVAMKLSLKNQ